MTKLRQKESVSKTGRIIFILFFCFAFFAFSFNFSEKVSADLEPLPTPKLTIRAKTAKVTEFRHDLRQHGKLNCNACHKFPSANWKRVRKDGEAFPDITDYPKHESCLSCHRQQFFGSPKPLICSVCHTNPSPKNSARHPFANPREIFDRSAKGKQAVSDFAISFPHDKHIEIVSRNEPKNGEFINAVFASKRKKAGEESCAVCHQTYLPQGDSDIEFLTKPPADLGDNFWLKKGTFKTSPISHANCFTCHSTETGILPAPTNCAACHTLATKLPKTDFDAKFAASVGDLDKITLTSWRNRDSSATFRHEFSSHSELDCATCHNAAALKTNDYSTKKVAVTSCNMCHITETSDDGGILNFEVDSRKKDASFQCVKCHIAFGKLPIPESHVKAITAAAGN